MRKKLLQLILLVLSLCQTAAFAQTSRVTGKVVGPDNAPIAGASITISGTSEGTVSDSEGNFSLNAPANATLLVNSIGFGDQSIKIGGRSTINVTLNSGGSAGLEEVVVTGYTSQKRKDIVGSVAVVDVKALKQIPSGSVTEVLQGQAPGVNVINTGSPGSGSSLLVRGVTGFGSNQPLVLIDGVQGNINLVPATDVESIQVLKDAGAASIYGSRGANGVIVITTKKGRSGTPKISYDSYYNLQLPYSGDKLNVLNAQEYATLFAQVSPATGLVPGGVLPDYLYKYRDAQSQAFVQGAANEGDPVVDPSKYLFDPSIYTNNYTISKVNKSGHTDWYDAVFNPALMMNHNVTASGGTDRSNYLLSFGYLDQNGTLINTYLKRYSVRVNTQFKVRDNIRLGENLYVYYQDNPQVPNNGAFGPIQQAYEQLPFLPIYDIGGNYAGPNVGPVNELGGWGNAKADLDLTSNNRSREYGINGNAFLEIDLIKHLTARTSFGGSVRNYYYQNYQFPQYWLGATTAQNNTLTETSGFQTTAQWTNTLNYTNDFGKHHLSVLAGVESIENLGRGLQGVGRGFVSNDYNYAILNNANVGTFPNFPSNPDFTIFNTALFSYISKLDYSFNDKYLLSLTFRRDGFSSFGSDTKYGNFPAVAAGWRISQEEFMKNVGWINDLKIRASYGTMGNNGNIVPANSFTTYRTGAANGNYDINGTGGSFLATGFYPATLGNDSTKWENNRSFNIGFDATLFNNKFDISADYYVKNTKGLLFVLPIPGTAGEGQAPSVNFGDVSNKGVDINMNYRSRLSRDVYFNVGLNFTTYNNKVVKIPAPGYGDEGRIRYEEGYPIGSFFGYKIAGIFQDSAEIIKAPLQQAAAPGRYRYQDTDGNDTINDLDRVHYGKADPDYTIGVNLGLTVKKFDFSAQIYTSQGNSLYNGLMEYLGSFEKGISNKSRRVLDAWTPQNTSSRIKKNEVNANFSNSGVNNDEFLEDGSFVRLRSVQVGYTLTTGGLKRWGLQSARVYLQGTNLITITKYSGLDPEVGATSRNAAGNIGYGVVSSRGNDAGSYPVQRGVVVGLNLTF